MITTAILDPTKTGRHASRSLRAMIFCDQQPERRGNELSLIASAWIPDYRRQLIERFPLTFREDGIENARKHIRGQPAAWALC
jgi:hypothetical protein